MFMSRRLIYNAQTKRGASPEDESPLYVAKAYKRETRTAPLMYNPQVAKEARDYLNYTYIATLVCGAIMVIWGLWSLINSLMLLGLPFVGMYAFGGAIWGAILAAAGAFGIYTALRVIQPKVIAKVDQGMYSEAHSTSSSLMTIIGVFAAGIIPGIILILANQKLTEVAGPAPAAPPPPPPV